MHDIHTIIVSQHVVARDNNKILCTHPPQVSSTEEHLRQAVHHIKAGHTLFFTRDSVCVKGSKKEVTGNGTDIHHSNGY